jgi:L-iditol 2-dehydrogenase
MLAAKFYGAEDIRVEEVSFPQFGSGDVLIKTKAAAICSSDLEAYRIGHERLADSTSEVEARRTPGHEFAGEVADVGEKVKGIEKGMRVAVAPSYGCGKCSLCHRGMYPVCHGRSLIGLEVDGGFAEYVRIPEEAVRQGALCAFSEDLPCEIAALNEPLACSYAGLMRCQSQPGDFVLIVGGGPIGMMLVALARLAGARRVIVSEPSEIRREMAKTFGADAVVDSNDPDYIGIIKDETGARGADVIMVSCGSPEAQRTALEVAAVRGRICFFGKLPKESQPNPLDSNLIYRKELSITGSYGSRTEFFAITLGLLDSGRIDLRTLISHTFPLKQIPEAYKQVLEDSRTGKGMKTVICGEFDQ